jgi:hypothetical protein
MTNWSPKAGFTRGWHGCSLQTGWRQSSLNGICSGSALVPDLFHQWEY